MGRDSQNLGLDGPGQPKSGKGRRTKWDRAEKTEEFVPGHLLLPLSRNKVTPGQEFFSILGQRDNRMSRPVETLYKTDPIVTIIQHIHKFLNLQN